MYLVVITSIHTISPIYGSQKVSHFNPIQENSTKYTRGWYNFLSSLVAISTPPLCFSSVLEKRRGGIGKIR